MLDKWSNSLLTDSKTIIDSQWAQCFSLIGKSVKLLVIINFLLTCQSSQYKMSHKNTDGQLVTLRVTWRSLQSLQLAFLSLRSVSAILPLQ